MNNDRIVKIIEKTTNYKGRGILENLRASGATASEYSKRTNSKAYLDKKKKKRLSEERNCYP